MVHALRELAENPKRQTEVYKELDYFVSLRGDINFIATEAEAMRYLIIYGTIFGLNPGRSLCATIQLSIRELPTLLVLG